MLNNPKTQLLIEILFYAGTVAVAVAALLFPDLFPVFLSQNFPFWIVSEFFVIHSVGMLSTFGAHESNKSRIGLLSAYLLIIGGATLLSQEWVLGFFIMASLVLRFWRTPLQGKGTDTHGPFIRSMVFVGSIFAVLFFGLPVMELVAPAFTAETHVLYAVLPFLVWIIFYYTLVTLISLITYLRSR